MIYQGHIEQGNIVLSEPVKLPDGTVVVVQLDEHFAATRRPTTSLHMLFGGVQSGDPRSADNVRIDRDLANEYAGGNHLGE